MLGLLEFIEWGGGDILYHASDFLSHGLGERFAAPGIVRDNMAQGRRGMRDGKGFYDFTDVDTDAYRDERMRAFISLLRSRDLMPRRPPARQVPCRVWQNTSR